jgi:hypothetical protein
VPGKPPREPAIENELEQVRKVEPVEELEPRDRPAPLVMPPDPDDPRRNDVLCVYDGDALQDLYAQLEDLGARPQRARLSGPMRFEGWSVAPRLFLIPASEALRIDLPPTLSGDTLCVAVANSNSEVLGSLVARLLFQRLLFQGEEGRRHERHAAGWPVQLRSGWRAMPATLLDLSGGGARLLVRSELDVLAEVRVRVPRSPAHRELSLPARVIRKRAHDDGTWSVAVHFEQPIADARLGELQRRLEGGSIGPASVPIRSLPERIRGWWSELLTRGSSAAEPAAPSAPPERRLVPRVALEREVLDLDPATRVPRTVLIGRDLPVQGLRVDPHPDLNTGDRLSLAIADATGSPLEIRACVVRNDAERGWALEFEPADDAVQARLEALVRSLPAIERLGEGAPRGVVFAEIVTDRIEVGALAR